MPYLVETWDKPGSEKLRLKIRDSHLEYLDGITEILLACGAKLNDEGVAVGGIYLIDTEEETRASELIENDPFYIAELFEKITIQRWRKAYFDGRNTLEE